MNQVSNGHEVIPLSVEVIETAPTTPHKVRRRSSLTDLIQCNGEDASLTFRVIMPNESVSQFYKLDTPLYEVGTKSITRCRKVDTGERFIMKRRGRDRGSEGEKLWRQITHKLLTLPPCDNICRLYEVFEDDSNFYIVMEECKGSQLLDYLLKEPAISQKVCKRIVRDILVGLSHLHAHHILHRDIKPENIMFGTSEPESILKIIDFDTCWDYTQEASPLLHATTPPTGRRRTRRLSATVIGTLGYVAPESFNGEYTTGSDMFSLGVIFYILMTGDIPFDDSIYHRRVSSLEGQIEVVGSPNNKRVYNDLRKSHIDWSINPWPAFPLAKDLCQKLLDIDPETRLSSAEEALKHAWFNNNSH